MDTWPVSLHEQVLRLRATHVQVDVTAADHGGDRAIAADPRPVPAVMIGRPTVR
jgi:hypothetical protein